MPAAMTKLPSDSFWATGIPDHEARVPYPKLTSDSQSSIISPLTLPRGVAGYFDHVSAVHPYDSAALHKPRGGQVYSPLSPGIRGPTTYPGSFLLPSAKQRQLPFDQHRSSSLPPRTRTNGITSPRGAEYHLRSPTNGTMAGAPGNDLSTVVNGAMPPISLASAGYARSVSADAASAPSHAQMIQRLVQQNARMREAWEAERKYLEANRERAEEVYKEERALMEEERADWEAEKVALLLEIERLRHALAAMEGQPLAINGARALSGTSATNLDLRGGTPGASGASTNGSLASQLSPRQSGQNGVPVFRNGCASFPPVTSLTAQDASGLKSPNGPSSSSPDFLKSGEDAATETGPIPVVDVKEIDPKLEGIRIKATTVKKATFTDGGPQNGSKASSRSGSPDQAQARSPPGKKEQTLQVLAAHPEHRLTMHAGHTPSHSLSSLATVASSGTATATSNGGDSTPTMPQEIVEPRRDSGTVIDEHIPLALRHASETFPGDYGRHRSLAVDDHPEPIMEASEDRELKGPLMVRNMPAHDEIFFQKLSDKLEKVCKDDKAALPAVLKAAEDAVEEVAAGESAQAANKVANKAEEEGAQPDGARRESAGSDGSAGSGGSKSSKSSPLSDEEEDLDVPIKFKKRMNFGAPFGEIR